MIQSRSPSRQAITRAASRRLANRDRRNARRGLSLLEAMVSLAILGGSLAAIGELISLGVRAAEEARDLTRAQMIADSILSEVSAKVASPTATTHAPCPNVSGFVYTLQTASAPTPDLLHIKLTIERESDIAINNPRGIRYSIERIIPDPNSQAFLPSYAAGSPEPAKVDFSGAIAPTLSGLTGGSTGQIQGTGAATSGQGQTGGTGATGGGTGS